LDTDLKAYLDQYEERLVQVQFQQIPDLLKYCNQVSDEILSREKYLIEWIPDIDKAINEKLPFSSYFIAKFNEMKKKYLLFSDKNDPDFIWRLLFTNDIVKTIETEYLEEFEKALIKGWQGPFDVFLGLYANRENARDLLKKMPRDSPKRRIPKQIQAIADASHGPVEDFGDHFRVVDNLVSALKVLKDIGDKLDPINVGMILRWLRQPNGKYYTRGTVIKNLTTSRNS
jgi:hypothetical protein